MAYLFYAILVGLIVFGLANIIVRANPASLASGIRIVIPGILLAIGVTFIMLGRAGPGSLFLMGAAALFARWRRVGRFGSSSGGKQSTVRSAALEMTLDHDTGEMDGIVLAGAFEGVRLANLTEGELMELRRSLLADDDSLALLEAYLDRKLAGWRDRTDAGEASRPGRTQGSGPMTEQEAYQILGLEAGAGAAEIRKAHRRLMQRLHPDVGGSEFIAARINAAKDLLLSRHG